MSAGPITGGVYRSLDHWRGLAALWVTYFHALGTEEKPLHPLVELLKVPARPGWLGVHLFFVISGYCIGANVHSLHTKGLGAMTFLRDRLCRILPTYWAAFGVTVVLSVVVGKFCRSLAGGALPADGRAWLGNLLLIQPYIRTDYYVVVYWTLVVELGFYFVMTLLYALANVSARLTAGLALALTVGALGVPVSGEWLVLDCWPEFVCGLLVFHAVQATHRDDRTRRNLCLGIILLLGIVGGVIAAHAEEVEHSPKQLLFGAGFALVLYALYPLDEAIHRTRALRWLGFCGTFSFSLYLIHAPFGVRVYGIGRRFFREESPFFALLVLASCLTSVAASYLFYRVFEMRFERWRRRFKAKPVAAVI